jgi:predicted ATP-binding protein involved in virulence
MRIDRIRLTNYRCHRDLEVRFTPHFNVLTGVNGSGKTSLLRGIAETFSALVHFVPGAAGGTQLLPDDSTRIERIEVEGRLRFEPQYPVTIEVSEEVMGMYANWDMARYSSAEQAIWKGLLPGTILQQQRNIPKEAQDSQPLPVLAFYRASRQWNAPRQNEMAAATQKNGRVDGYQYYADASTASPLLITWVIAKCLERFQISSETGVAFDDIDNDELALVNGAISAAIEEAKGIKYDMREKSLLVEWKQCDFPERRPTIFENLSDGQKAIICLIADLARRICLLNPQLGQEAMKQTPGVVLIDELDMHLHPKWQRSLTLGLQKAFPAVQFIVASHSPQILSEMQPEQIIVLTAGSASHPQVSYGLDSSAVLEEIMDASPRPKGVSEELSQLFAALDRNELETARHLLAELRSSAPGVADLTRAEALLKRKEVVGR